MSVSSRGKAIFSTRLGRFLPREAIEPRGPIALRSEPEDDLDSMIARLERDFPAQSRAITLPIKNIYEYFDHYDCHVLGTGFLHKVLENIVFRNFTRSQRVREIVNGSKEGKLASFDRMAVAQSLHDVFTETEIAEYGEDILGEAFAKIGDLARLDSDREAVNAQHRKEGLHHNIQKPLLDPSVQPQRNSSAPQSSRISYALPQISQPPAQRSNSALDIQSNDLPEEVSGLSFSQGQVATDRKDRYSDPSDNTLQVPMQGFPSDTAARPSRAPPIPIFNHPTALDIGKPQDMFQAHIFQPHPIMRIPIAKKPPPMGFSNDARNLIKQPTGATTVTVSPVQQTMHMPHPAAEYRYPRDMGGVRSAFGSDHTKQPYSVYSAASPFGEDNHLDQARFLANDYPAAAPFRPRTGGRRQYRRSLSNQSQSAFHLPAAASNLAIVPALLPPVFEPYRHFSTGHMSTQAAWSQDGDLSIPTNLASAEGFSQRQQPRQNCPQLNIDQAQRGLERCDNQTLYVGWFPSHIDSEMLRKIFAHCGPILHISCPRASMNAFKPDCSYYAFIEYASASSATEAIKAFHGRPLDFLGGPSDSRLRVQPPNGPWDDRYNREGMRTPTFSKPGGSPYRRYHKNEGKFDRKDYERRDFLPLHNAKASEAYADGNHRGLTRSTTLDNQPGQDGKVTTQLIEETMEIPPHIDPITSEHGISQRKVAIKLPSTGNDERGRQRATELKVSAQNIPIMANVLSPKEKQDSRLEQASQERAGNTGSGIVLDKADRNTKIPTESRAENKSTVPRSTKEKGLELATSKISTARAKPTLARVEKSPEKSTQPQTGEKSNSNAQSQKAAEGYPKPKTDVKNPTQAPLGKNPKRYTKELAGEGIQQYDGRAKPSNTKTGIIGTTAVTTTLQPNPRPDRTAHVILKEGEVYSTNDGSMTLTASTESKQEAASVGPQDEPVSSPMSRVDSSSTKYSDMGGPSPFVSTEPTTYAHSEQSDSGTLESQIPIANSTTKGVPSKPSNNSTRPDDKLNQKAATSSSHNLDPLATITEQINNYHDNKKSSIPPSPLTGAVNPTSSNRPLVLSTENPKDPSPDKSDSNTITFEEQSLGTSGGGSKVIVNLPSSAPTGKIVDRGLMLQANASSNAPDKFASPELDISSKIPDDEHGPQIPPRLSSLVNPVTPILTHMKKQRNLKSPRTTTDNTYAGLNSRALNTPYGENSVSASDLAEPSGKGSGPFESLEHDQLGKAAILRAQKESDAASIGTDRLLQPFESAQDRQVSQEPKTEQAEAPTLQSTMPIPSTESKKTGKKTTKTKRKPKSKGSKDSTAPKPAAVESILIESASNAHTTLPEPETPFIIDESMSLPLPMDNNRSNGQDSGNRQMDKSAFLSQFPAAIEEYYRKKAEDYEPKLRQAMLYNDSTMDTASSNPPNDTSPPKRAKIDDADDELVETARRLGYLGNWRTVMDTPVEIGPRVVSLRETLNAFDSRGQRKTSDSEDSLSTLGGSDESNSGQLQKANKKSPDFAGEYLTSNDSFHKQMAEVDTAMQNKCKTRELALPSQSRVNSERYPNQEEVLSQLTPEAQKIFHNLQSNPTMVPSAQAPKPVTPSNLQYSTSQVRSPQQIAVLEQLNISDGHQTAAELLLEHGQDPESIATNVKPLSPPERQALAALEAQFAETSLPLRKVNESLAKSPSKEHIHKIAETSKLTESSRGILVNMVAQGLSPPASPTKQQPPTFSQRHSLPSTANLPPSPPRPAHKKLPSYSEVATSPPKKSVQLQSSLRRSAQLPSLQPGDTVEVTQLGMDTLTAEMIREGPLQRPYRAGSEGPYREESGRKGRGRRRTQEGPERPFIERRDRGGWSMAARQLAHNNDVDPWGVPRGEKAWGSGSGR